MTVLTSITHTGSRFGQRGALFLDQNPSQWLVCRSKPQKENEEEQFALTFSTFSGVATSQCECPVQLFFCQTF